MKIITLILLIAFALLLISPIKTINTDGDLISTYMTITAGFAVILMCGIALIWYQINK